MTPNFTLAGIAGLSLACALAHAHADGTGAPLPLGRPDLKQATVIDETLASGVHHQRIQRGTPDKAGTWKLSSGVLTEAAEISQARQCFEALKLKADSVPFELGEGGQQRYDILSGGRYPTRAAAQAAQARARAMKCLLNARHSSDDLTNTSGPWLIDVVTLAPDSTSALSVLYGQKGASLRTRTTQQAKAAGALVAVNGGFFTMLAEDGAFPGQPSGTSIADGQLNSAPVAARPGLVLRRGSTPAVSIEREFDIRSALQWQDGSGTVVDGINRRPGKVRDCGRNAGDKAVHDHTCDYADDVVYVPAGSGFVPAMLALGNSAVRYAIDGNGQLRRLDAGVRPADTEGTLLVTPGSPRLEEIQRQVQAHQAAAFKSESRRPELLAAGTDVVNGGPTLLMGGQAVRDDVAEGWGIGATGKPDAKHDLLIHDWVNRRNPRTAVGIKEDGTVLLLAVDGHRHDASVGLTIEELRAVLKSLGARDAMNLDGGGSTAIVIGGKLINKPSDPSGERAVGDVLAIVPRKNGNP